MLILVLYLDMLVFIRHQYLKYQYYLKKDLDNFIITVLAKDIFHAMMTKMLILVLYLDMLVFIRHQYLKYQYYLKKDLDNFIITVLAKDIFHAMMTKMGFTAGPKSESIYLMKSMKFCTHILDT